MMLPTENMYDALYKYLSEMETNNNPTVDYFFNWWIPRLGISFGAPGIEVLKAVVSNHFPHLTKELDKRLLLY